MTFNYLTTEQNKILHFLFKKYYGEDMIDKVMLCLYNDCQEEIVDIFDFKNTSEALAAEFEEITGFKLVAAIALIQFEDEEDEEEIEEAEIDRLGVRQRL